MIDYFEVKAYSASAIKAGAVSMLNMQNYLENGVPTTASMNRGTLQHMAVLEPEKLAEKIVLDYDGRTKEGKAILEQYGKENIIKPAEKADAELAAKMAREHAAVKALGLFESGKPEQELYWQTDGIDCKCKVDWLADDYFIEYKTTNAIRRFASAAAGMFYQLQLGWYWFGCGRKKCYVIPQEQKKPFDVAVFEVPELMLRQWYQQAFDIVKRYESGDRSGAYPCLMQFELPTWAADADPIFDENSELEF